MKQALPFLATLIAFSAPMPVLAQSGGRELIIFGQDKCPTDSSGNEIVVCSRRPEAERFRIPKELRTPAPSPENQSWSQRAASTVNDVGRTGAGSCSAVGGMGWTGCFLQDFKKARAEKRRQEAAAREGTAP
jgi:hypothetical protein